ncbi:hypothetical protein [Streptomyces sp. NPDC005322]|uniref:hypothetical protein n=1 Tax=Streptomyces sp. NPDC005322 TaxID=3157032 RepID=UPI0033B73465
MRREGGHLASGSQADAAVDAAGVRNMPRQVGRRATLPGLSGRISFDERAPRSHTGIRTEQS